MKTLLTSAALAAVVATTAAAHTCGIADADIKSYPGYATDGNVYDRGDYLFTSSTEHFSNGDALTTHTRIYKDGCVAKSMEIFHKNEEPKVAAAPVVEEPKPEVVAPVTKTRNVVKTLDRTGDSGKRFISKDITVTWSDGRVVKKTRTIVIKPNGKKKTVTIANHTKETAVRIKMKKSKKTGNWYEKSRKDIPYNNAIPK